MWFENVVIILTWLIILAIYLKICVKKKNIASFTIIGLDVLVGVVYFITNFMGIKENINIIQILALIFMYILPLVAIYIHYKKKLSMVSRIISPTKLLMYL